MLYTHTHDNNMYYTMNSYTGRGLTTKDTFLNSTTLYIYLNNNVSEKTGMRYPLSTLFTITKKCETSKDNATKLLLLFRNIFFLIRSRLENTRRESVYISNLFLLFFVRRHFVDVSRGTTQNTWVYRLVVGP